MNKYLLLLSKRSSSSSSSNIVTTEKKMRIYIYQIYYVFPPGLMKSDLLKRKYNSYCIKNVYISFQSFTFFIAD